jgi:hypothetical protein
MESGDPRNSNSARTRTYTRLGDPQTFSYWKWTARRETSAARMESLIAAQLKQLASMCITTVPLLAFVLTGALQSTNLGR